MNKKLIYPAAVIILGFAVALRISLGFESQKQKILPKNQEIQIRAVLKGEPRLNEYGQVLQIGDSRFYVPFYPRFHSGDKLEIDGEIDGEGRSFNSKVRKTGQNAGFSLWLVSLRLKLSANVNSILPSREATLISGVVLGIDNIDSNLREILIKTGTIHVVVVSGQNLTLVAGIFVSLAKYLGRRKSLAISTIAVVFYAFLAGLEPPVARAAIMVLASTVSIYFGRQVWPVWSLGISAMIIAFLWPSSIFEASFQLTFAATLGIMTLGQTLARIFKPFPIIGESSAIAVSAYIFTLPVIAYHFGRISLTAPIANILVSEAVFPMMILGFLTVFASLIFQPLAIPFAYLAYVPSFYFLKVVEFFSKIGGQIEVGEGNVWFLIFGFLLLAGLFLVLERIVHGRKI